jgi:hypothetical protein
MREIIQLIANSDLKYPVGMGLLLILTAVAFKIVTG